MGVSGVVGSRVPNATEAESGVNIRNGIIVISWLNTALEFGVRRILRTDADDQ